MSDPIILQKRCVVVLGKSGAGKSTVANMLAGHDPISTDEPPFRVSKKVLASVTRKVDHRVIQFTRDNTTYQVTVIDTVGLFDTKAEGNDIIFDKMEEYFRDYIDGINLVLFVFKKGRFTTEEEEVFSFLRKKFDKEISPLSALAVTGFELDDADARREFVEEFRSDPTTKEVASRMKKGIYPVGFPPLQRMDSRLQEFHKPSMLKDKETLMDVIIRSGDTQLTKKLFKERLLPYLKHIYKTVSDSCTYL